jgi:hypothetical protein
MVKKCYSFYGGRKYINVFRDLAAGHIPVPIESAGTLTSHINKAHFNISILLYAKVSSVPLFSRLEWNFMHFFYKDIVPSLSP